MIRVACALIPGIIVHAYFFGTGVLVSCAITAVVAVVTELACTRNLKDIADGSACVTGLLIGASLPPEVPIYVPLLAAIIAIALAKHAYGGLGQNTFNPAMVGYAAVLVAFPQSLTHYDAVTGATALDVLAHRGGATIDEISQLPAFGSVGAIGYEWTNFAFLIGGVYLLLNRIIAFHIPLSVLVGLGIPALLFYDAGSSSSLGSPLFHLFSGGTMLVAFFVATDPVTSPMKKRDQWIYGIFVGVIALVIRVFGAWPDGFAFAILLGNLLVPLLDRMQSIRESSI